MLLDERLKDLIKNIELIDSKDSLAFTAALKECFQHLKIKLQQPLVCERYASYRENNGAIGHYPIDAEGYAVAYDPLEDEQGFWNAWSRYGMVVGKKVVSKESCHFAIKRMHDITRDISDGACILDVPETWHHAPVDASGISLFSRGFFEIYHDKALSDLRQSIRLYIHHVMLWGRVDLWTSYDRFGVKLPGHEESYALPLHVDQNPLIHPGFKTVQGVVALTDCPMERGTFVGVPGSRAIFSEYGRFAPERGEFVELSLSDPISQMLQDNAQAIPLREGDIVSWDSRTTHANSENISKDARYVAYISAGPAREDSPELIAVRAEAFRTGIGTNVREALMHASKKARYSNYEKLEKVREPEQFTLLGELLYGKKSYEKI